MNYILKVSNRIIPMSAAYDKIMYESKLVNDTTILIKRETSTYLKTWNHWKFHQYQQKEN